MLLIAENKYENEFVANLSTLLCDLGFDASGLRSDEALALTFWAADDVILTPSTAGLLTPEEQKAFMIAIEEDLRSAMIAAGVETMERELARYIVRLWREKTVFSGN